MPKTQSNRTKAVSVRLGPQTKELAERYAKAREMTLGEFIRYTMRCYFDSTPEDPNEDIPAGDY